MHDGSEFLGRGIKLDDDLHFHVDSTQHVVEMYAAPLLAVVASRQNEDTTVVAEQLHTVALAITLDNKDQTTQNWTVKRRRRHEVDHDAELENNMQRKETQQPGR